MLRLSDLRILFPWKDIKNELQKTWLCPLPAVPPSLDDARLDACFLKCIHIKAGRRATTTRRHHGAKGQKCCFSRDFCK